MLPDLYAALRTPVDGDSGAGNIVIEAPPGAGKTTLVPLAVLDCLDGPLNEPGAGIIVLQPRRLAARLSAQRVASLVGERVGARVGYAVRFDRATSAQTRITFMTEGLLLRRLRADPELVGVGVVILDEFHERHLDGDLVLALLRRRQRRQGGSGLRLIAMSATLDAEPVAAFLGATRLRTSGRSFPVTVSYRSPKGARRGPERARVRPLEAQVVGALRDWLADPASDPAGEPAGHVLVFLPGAREIQACAESCARVAEEAGLELLRLHARLPRVEQDRVLAPSPVRRKLILTTNVAETSITIDGVVAVIDSGLARVADFDPGSGLPRLSLEPISRASAAQRAGRAGRTRPGVCVRLYSQFDHDHRREHDLPEVLRLDLAGPLLDLAAAGIGDARDFEWFEAPPGVSCEAAAELLERLGAVTRGRQGELCGEDPGEMALTPTGREMLRYPLHPRAARLMVEGVRLGVPSMAAKAAASLGARALDRPGTPAARACEADLIEELEALEQAWSGRRISGWAGRAQVIRERAKELRRSVDQLEKLASRGRGRGPKSGAPGTREQREGALRQALLAAHPDRVARVRVDDHDRRTLVFAFGGSAELGVDSGVRARWVLALRSEARREGTRRRAVVRSACAIEAEWLLDQFPELVVDDEQIVFDPGLERVVGSSALRYGKLVIESSALPKLPAEAASEVLWAAAKAVGLASFCPPQKLEQLRLRLGFIVSSGRGGDFDLGLDSDAGGDSRAEAERVFVALEQRCLAAMCVGRISFAELRKADVLAGLRVELGRALGDHRALDRLAPSELRLPGGRRLEVHYEPDRPPWVGSRLQDFFGLAQGPRVLDGTVPVVLHLRAPNRHDVAVTTDLAGFWREHYPALRRQLGRRYPRHDWAEDPLRASPPRAGGRRRRS